MKLEVLLPFLGAVFFLIAEAIVIIKMICLAKKHENKTIEELSKKMLPLIGVSGAFSFLLAVCMLLVVIFR